MIDKRQSTKGQWNRRTERITLPFHLTKKATGILAGAPKVDLKEIRSNLGNVTIEPLVRSINLVDALRRKGEELPDYVEQY
jgi:hypothetical protein